MAHLFVIYPDIETGYSVGLHHGLASLAGAVRQRGHQFTLHHLTAEEPPSAVVEKIQAIRPSAVGFSVTTNQKRFVAQYSRALAAASEVIQVAGGIHATIDPADMLCQGAVQGVCLGEGDSTAPDLLDRLDRLEPVTETPGFWWKNDRGGVIRNPVPPINRDLASLPLPDYSIFPTAELINACGGWMDIMLGRGCPYQCSYCCNHALRSVYPNPKDYVRLPTVDRALETIRDNLKKYPAVKAIGIADDLFLCNQRWFLDFIRRYRGEIGLPFSCNGRVGLLTDEICLALKQAGCVMVKIGVESGNPWLRQQIMGRPMTNQQIIEAFDRVKSHGMQRFAYNMMGLPFETEEFMRQTIALNRRLAPEVGNVFYFYPFPATRLHALCQQFDLLPESLPSVTGYMESPVVRLTHCSERRCRIQYNRLKLYLFSRLATKNFGAAAPMLAQLLYLATNIYPSYFAERYRKRSKLKAWLRRIYYRKVAG